MFLLTLYLCFQLAFSASSGAKKCDALGLCLIQESGAYVNDAGNVTCPWGMHKVSPPQRNNAYVVSTAPYGETGKTFYTPGEVMDIHVTVVGEPHMKFLGILMYAVQNDGELGVEGCPGGCDGKEEVKVGSWEAPNSLFQVSAACDGQAVTHTNADVKPYTNVFRWRAPEEEGYGDVIFRVLIKQGSTNMGHFWWPMEEDLMLTEGSLSSISEWVSGSQDSTCQEICAQQGMQCDRSMPTGSLDHYSDHVGKKLSCQLPLLSSCSRGSITRGEDGYCWFDNTESGLCDSEAAHVNVCDAVEVAGGSERLCPCVPEGVDGWVPQTTQAPTAFPSVVPSLSPSVFPSLSPSTWYAPRWVEVLDITTTCATRFSRPCKKGCSREFCQERCAADESCNFYSRAYNGRCELYRSCSETRSFEGVTVEKLVATTQEPSFSPTVSSPTSVPTSSSPSCSPSESPTAAPTTTEPSFQPTVMPSEAPSVVPTSAPSLSPSHWYDPRWVQILDSTTTCASRFSRPCRKGCTHAYCQEQCAVSSRCNFFSRHQNGRCELYQSCSETRSFTGITIEKIVATTQEPSFSPTLSSPTSAPSSSFPTRGPSESPTAAPTTPEPSFQPTVMPSGEPSVTPTSAPSSSPSHWYDPRWIYVYGSETSGSTTRCDANGVRIALFREGHTDLSCRAECASRDACNFYWRSWKGRCELLRSCDETREDRSGVSVQKYVETTAEPSSSPSTSPTTWNTPRWVEVDEACANRHRIARPCDRQCSRAFCQERCAENDECAFFHRFPNGRCELFKACDRTRSANGVTVQKVIPTTLEPTTSLTQGPRRNLVDMEETLLLRQTYPWKWSRDVWSLNADDATSANYAILDQLEQFRFDGSFHFRLVWPNDEEGVSYEWLQTSNPLTEDVAGYVPIHIPYTGRSWGGLEPSQNALMDGSVNHSNWYYTVGSYKLWKGGYPSYAKTRKDTRYPQSQVELYVVAPQQQ